MSREGGRDGRDGLCVGAAALIVFYLLANAPDNCLGDAVA